MAEGDAAVPNSFLKALLLKKIDFVNDTFKVAMYTSSYTWSKDGNDQAYSATNELSASNYSAGGVTLGSLNVAQNDTDDEATFDAADATWTALGTSSPRHALLYDDTTTPKYVCVHWEIATDANGGNYTLQFASDGILALS